MFGIGGGELIFILFVMLMLFGSDKVPEIARTMGKAMAQLKNATNDIKSEIQKGAEANGLDPKMLSDLKSNLNADIDSAKSNLLGNSNPLRGISDNIASEIDQVKKTITEENTAATPNESSKNDLATETATKSEEVEEVSGPIKRKK